MTSVKIYIPLDQDNNKGTTAVCAYREKRAGKARTTVKMLLKSLGCDRV
jgi:hypothetical protein